MYLPISEKTYFFLDHVEFFKIKRNFSYFYI